MSGTVPRVLTLILATQVAADSQRTSSEVPAIRVDVGVVRVPVTVRGPLGNPVPGLQREHFRVFENDTERPIRYFSSQDSPVSIGILLDTSGSMNPKLRETRDAVSRLLRTAAAGDEYFLIAFADRPRMRSDIGRDANEILRTLPRLRASGWTALLDALDLGLRTIKRASNSRKALLLISDGADNRSRLTQTELENHIRESDTCVYALAVFDEQQSEHNLRLLADLTEETGGIMLTAHTAMDLPGSIEQLARHIRNHYVLGYTPETPYDGRYRRVNVQLVLPDADTMTVSSRAGYYAPSPAAKQ